MQKRILPLKAGKPRTRRFTDEEVWTLRRRVRDGEKMIVLARELDVSRPCIADAVYGRGAYKEI